MKKDPRHHIYERDKWKCVYCGLDGKESFETWWHANLNIDHVKPKKFGGTNDDSNLVVACRACNSYKGQTDCDSVEQGKQIIANKKEQSRQWYNHFVLSRI